MAITFQVNLQTTNLLSSKGPYSSNDPHGANFAFTRSIWAPDFLRNNFDLTHGATITMSGEQALYLLNNYTFSSAAAVLAGQGANPNNTYCFLDYVSGLADIAQVASYTPANTGYSPANSGGGAGPIDIFGS